MNQTATYWAPDGTSGITGELQFAAPVTISCRWIEKEDKYISPEGRDEVSSSTVWTESSISENGYLFLGVSSESDPLSVQDAFIVRRIREVPSTDGSKTARRIML